MFVPGGRCRKKMLRGGLTHRGKNLTLHRYWPMGSGCKRKVRRCVRWDKSRALEQFMRISYWHGGRVTYRALQGTWRARIIARWNGNGINFVRDTALHLHDRPRKACPRVSLTFSPRDNAVPNPPPPPIQQPGRLSSGRTETSVAGVHRIVEGAVCAGLV